MPPDLPPDHPEDELAERGRLLVAEAVAGTRAPQQLRVRLEAERGRRWLPAARWRRGRVLAPVLALAATVVVAVVLATGGSSPTVLGAAQLAVRGAALPAPAADARRPAALRAEVDGVAFPAWYDAFGWRASGAREDALEGRSTRTVFYAADGVEAAYTIVSGEALPIPEDSEVRRVGGTVLWVLGDEGRRVVVWERDGHTCVMSASHAVPEQRLLELAAWDGGGRES